MRRLPAALVFAALVTVTVAIVVMHDGAEARPRSEGEPQGIGAYPRYDWNHDVCSDLFDVGIVGGPLIWLKRNCPLGSFADPVTVGNPLALQFVDAYVLVGDWNKDGCVDMVARQGDALLLYEYNCATNAEKQIPTILPQFASRYDWILGPGSWDGDSCPDLITREAGTGYLLLFLGDCEDGLLEGAGHIIGTGWGGFNWISAPGDWDGDGCADLLARRADDGTLWRYDGDCFYNFKDNGVQIGTGWDGFDWILAGGNWDQGGDNCPDIAARESVSGNLYMYGGNCAGGFKDFQHVFLYNIGNHIIIPGDASGLLQVPSVSRTWGDTDCSGSIAPRDSQAGLKHFLSQGELSQTQPCPAIGSTITIGGVPHLWGDNDCNGSIAPRDSQAGLRHFLSQGELSQTQPCPVVGMIGQVSP